MVKEKVLDFTKFTGICGDPTVYVLEAAEADGEVEVITVIHNKKRELEEAAEQLKEMGFEILSLSERDGKTILKVKVPSR